MTPETVAQAAKLIRTGEVIELGRVLSSDMPLFGTRRFDLYTKRTGGPMGTNKRYSNEEVVTTEIGQVGTQFDMFSHQGIDGLSTTASGSTRSPRATASPSWGWRRSGTVRARRAGGRGGPQGRGDAAVDYEIGVADIEAALAREHLTLQAGDAVLDPHGLGPAVGRGQREVQPRCPGIGVAAAEWLAKQDVLLIGGDTAPVEILPNPDKQLDLPVHQIALVVNGIFLLENLKLDELAAKGVYEFAFMVEPLKIRGGTGSTVAPIAIR